MRAHNARFYLHKSQFIQADDSRHNARYRWEWSPAPFGTMTSPPARPSTATTSAPTTEGFFSLLRLVLF
ncbi:unnamed protein product [Bemisia tabaci]|uniref:Uncharacterized protein n=1 Tax=Bemisia tabaci TaxID=7038 RepID=A0A9P0AFN6_BEMTA|nr:unnamed protein product [Bemisia tabaci]